MGFEVAAIAAIAVVGAVAASSAAEKNNDALEEQGLNAKTAAGLNAEQVVEQRQMDRIKKRNEREQIVGRVRVSAAENGVGTGGSTAALERQARINESINEGGETPSEQTDPRHYDPRGKQFMEPRDEV